MLPYIMVDVAQSPHYRTLCFLYLIFVVMFARVLHDISLCEKCPIFVCLLVVLTCCSVLQTSAHPSTWTTDGNFTAVFSELQNKVLARSHVP